MKMDEKDCHGAVNVRDERFPELYIPTSEDESKSYYFVPATGKYIGIPDGRDWIKGYYCRTCGGDKDHLIASEEILWRQGRACHYIPHSSPVCKASKSAKRLVPCKIRNPARWKCNKYITTGRKYCFFYAEGTHHLLKPVYQATCETQACPICGKPAMQNDNEESYGYCCPEHRMMELKRMMRVALDDDRDEHY